MTKKLFVGNLAYAMTDDQLTQIFSAHGQVVSVNIIKDRFSQRSKGFGFVEFATEEEAAAAMQALDGSDQEGRNMVVKEATPRADDNKAGSPVATAPVGTEIPEAPVAEETPVEPTPTTETVSPAVETDAPEAPVAKEAPVEPTVEAEAEVAPAETDAKTEEAPVLEEVKTEETEEK